MTSLIGADVLEELTQAAFHAPEGDIVEVGVYLGGSALCLYQAAREKNSRLFLYDTFTGIPCKDETDVMRVGDFADCSYEHVKFMFPDATVIKGTFPGSAVPMGPISFAHIDCDQYRSVRDAIFHLQPMMVQGGIMWFDDYGYLGGATRAVDEYFPSYVLQQAKCGKTFVVVHRELYVS